MVTEIAEVPVLLVLEGGKPENVERLDPITPSDIETPLLALITI
jgi:hypothetical protein